MHIAQVERKLSGQVDNANSGYLENGCCAGLFFYWHSFHCIYGEVFVSFNVEI